MDCDMELSTRLNTRRPAFMLETVSSFTQKAGGKKTCVQTVNTKFRKVSYKTFKNHKFDFCMAIPEHPDLHHSWGKGGAAREILSNHSLRRRDMK